MYIWVDAILTGIGSAPQLSLNAGLTGGNSFSGHFAHILHRATWGERVNRIKIVPWNGNKTLCMLLLGGKKKILKRELTLPNLMFNIYFALFSHTFSPQLRHYQILSPPASSPLSHNSIYQGGWGLSRACSKICGASHCVFSKPLFILSRRVALEESANCSLLYNCARRSLQSASVSIIDRVKATPSLPHREHGHFCSNSQESLQ